MKILINAIDDNRYKDNPDNINVDDYELVNIQSNDSDDFFIFQKLYSRNEASSGLEYFRILDDPNDSEKVKETPFIKVIDDSTNYLNIPKNEIHKRSDFIDNRNEDFLDFMDRVFLIKNPINLPDEYKENTNIKFDDILNNTLNKKKGKVRNPNFNYTINHLDDNIFDDTDYNIEPSEVITHGINNIFNINNTKSLIRNTANLYNGATHYNLAFPNYFINHLGKDYKKGNIEYNFNENYIKYTNTDNNTDFKIYLSDIKYMDKIIRRMPYVLNTSAEILDNHNLLDSLPNRTANPIYSHYYDKYYYTKYFDLSKTEYKMTRFEEPSFDYFNDYKLTKLNYDNSCIGNAIADKLYSTNKPDVLNLSGTIFTFNLEDDDKYLQLYISNIFMQSIFCCENEFEKPATIRAIRITDATYNKYITPYNINMNVTTHLPYTDHYSRWHIHSIISYFNQNNRKYTLF